EIAVYVRFGAAIAALAAAAAGIIVVVTLLRSVPGPTSPAASAPAAPAIGAPATRAIAGGRIATPNDAAFPSPPPDAVVLARAAVVRRATDTWTALRSLVWHERLASSPTNALDTLYWAVAPHTLTYTIAGRSSAVIIGGRRWDRSSPTALWRMSFQNPPVRQPQPFWQEATDAYLLGASQRAWRVS